MPPGPEAPSTAAPNRTLLDRVMGAAAVRWFCQLPLMLRILSPAKGERMIHKFIRYSMVSGVAIVISQAAILICTAGFHTSGILANTVGALVATPASYELNRKWAWGKRGKSHLWKEVAPFWGLTLLGYLGSTGTVQLADNLCRTHHIGGLTRSLAIMGASLLAYGVVWIVKFFVFQHLVFGKSTGHAGSSPGARDEVPAELVVAVGEGVNGKGGGGRGLGNGANGNGANGQGANGKGANGKGAHGSHAPGDVAGAGAAAQAAPTPLAPSPLAPTPLPGGPH